MAVPTFPTITEQVATYLREDILRGRWSGEMPGQKQLAKLLGVSGQTVELALGLLEKDGLLVGQGTGRRRRIVLPENHVPPGLRIALLEFDAISKGTSYMIDLRHRLEAAGHVPFFTDKSLDDLGRDTGRVARYVKRTVADAWIVGAGSHDILEWFSRQEAPSFAMFGAREGLPIAATGPDKGTTLVEVTRRLISLGHRRITLVGRREIRQPKPTQSVRAYLDELEAAGIPTGRFNLPDWGESAEGFGRLLESLFGGPTPPTALILDEAFEFYASYQYLSGRGLKIPQDVSLVCTDDDPGFIWYQPPVSHIRWDHSPVVRRVVRWANNVSAGKEDRRQSLTKAEFVEGGTVGRVPG